MSITFAINFFFFLANLIILGSCVLFARLTFKHTENCIHAIQELRKIYYQTLEIYQKYAEIKQTNSTE